MRLGIAVRIIQRNISLILLAPERSHLMKTKILLFLILIAACSALGSRALLAQLEDVIRVPQGTRLMMDLETPLDSSVTREGDEVYLRMRNDVRVGSKLAIPRNVVIKGTVSRVEPSMVNGKKREAELHVRLGEITLTDGGILKVVSEPIKLDTRDNIEPMGAAKVLNGGLQGLSQSASVVTTGAMIGAMYGGGFKRAAYGAAAAASVGMATGIFKKSKGNGGEVQLFPGSVMETFLSEPLEIAKPSLLSKEIPSSLQSTWASGMAATGNRIDTAPPPPNLSNRNGIVVADNSAPHAVSPPVFNSFSVENASKAIEESEKTAADSVDSFARPDNIFKVKVDVNLVPIDVVVRDRSGQPKAALRKEDFRVFEDGVEQSIQMFSKGQAPLAVALVIDRSGSVAPLMGRIKTAAYQALQQLNRDDTVCLFAFAGDVQRLENLTNDRRRIANRIGMIKAGGGTRIMDAVDEALRYMHQAAPDRRRAVILISDNLEGSSFTSADRVVQTALETEAVVYSVKLTERQSPHGMGGSILGLSIPSIPLPSMGRDPVSTITKDTGGELFSVTSSSIDSAFSTAISRLRLRYTLGYTPDKRSRPRHYHAIEVRLASSFGKAGTDYTVLSRRGYYE
jgi:Ca-activated chloride channel family protein